MFYSGPRRRNYVDVVSVDVVPDAAAEDRNVMRQVEDGGDEGKADEEEHDRVCIPSVSKIDPSREVREGGDDEGNVQKANFSYGVNMYTAKVTSICSCLRRSHSLMDAMTAIVSFRDCCFVVYYTVASSLAHAISSYFPFVKVAALSSVRR